MVKTEDFLFLIKNKQVFGRNFNYNTAIDYFNLTVYLRKYLLFHKIAITSIQSIMKFCWPPT